MRALGIVALILAGCGGEGQESPAVPVTLDLSSCEAPEVVPRPPLRRLSRAQLTWTLHDLFDDLAEHAPGLVSDAVRHVPDDTPVGEPGAVRGGLRRLDQTVLAEHVAGMLELGGQLADGLALDTPEGARALFDPGCPLDDAEPGCIEGWIRGVGARMHRRPLTEDDVAHYRAVYDAADQPLRDVILAMFASPFFGYHVELGDPAREGALSAHELANRLAFHLWQAPPDAALRSLAADDRLLEDAVYDAEVERLLADPRAERGLGELFADWLRVDGIEPMNRRVGTPVFDGFRGGFDPHPGLHLSMRDELVSLGVFHSLVDQTDLEGFFRSDALLAEDPYLSLLYGTRDVWDGGPNPPRLDDDARVGLLTRVGLLATGSANTRPVRKGVFVREALLCDTLDPPPAEANTAPPELSPEQTTREVLVALTEQEGSSCSGCHSLIINPLGYATEGFDALGRRRGEEALRDAEGQIVARRALDATGTAVIDGRRVSFDGPGQLTDALMASGAVHACFTREAVRFALSRLDSPVDACVLDTATEAMVRGLPLIDLFAALARTPQFKTLGAVEAP